MSKNSMTNSKQLKTPDWTEKEIEIAQKAEKLRDTGKLKAK